jgi:hypothetical protein
MSRKATYAYLYSDGTLVQLFNELRGNNKIGETADITYNYCDVALMKGFSYTDRTSKSGRIVFQGIDNGQGFIKLAKDGKVRAHEACLVAGSNKTRDLGIAVQYVVLTTKSGIELSWNEVPGILSGSFLVQVAEQWTIMQSLQSGDRLWSDVRVNKVTRNGANKKEVAA